MPLPWRYWLTHWVTTLNIHHHQYITVLRSQKHVLVRMKERLSCFSFIMTVVTKLFDVLNFHINEHCPSRLVNFCFIFLIDDLFSSCWWSCTWSWDSVLLYTCGQTNYKYCTSIRGEVIRPYGPLWPEANILWSTLLNQRYKTGEVAERTFLRWS